MVTIYTGAFWKATFERGVKTFAQASGAVLTGTALGLFDADRTATASVAGMAALLSVLSSVGSDLATDGAGPSLTDAETLYDAKHQDRPGAR